MPVVMTAQQRAEQARIVAQLRVRPDIDGAAELRRRTAFLADYLRDSGLESLVVGVSGGVDSLLAGLLAQRAVRQLREQAGMARARCIAVRLPYGRQHDEADAQACLERIHADQILAVDIAPGVDALMASLEAGGMAAGDASRRDFVLGNIKARARMVALFAVAGAQRGLVVGTDQAAETLVGFSTKYGDTAADIMPLAGLNKRQVRALARQLGAPDVLVDKVPTADLESLTPQRPDEAAIGVSYDVIDDFLEGRAVPEAVARRILALWEVSAHKRALPPEP